MRLTPRRTGGTVLASRSGTRNRPLPAPSKNGAVGKKRKRGTKKGGTAGADHRHPSIVEVMAERTQAHETRKPLFHAIEKLLKKPVVTFFTSFSFPVMLEDGDVDMLEAVLQRMDLSRGFVLMISCPGGDGLAAERIVNLCRSYSATGEFWALVPGKAKSAATMVCFGASRILMGASSELGPVDPQVVIKGADGFRQLSVHNIVKSYDELVDKAVQTTGNPDPYLQQLAHYDAREIQEFKVAMELADDIAVRSLKSGMMSKYDEKKIRKKIAWFLSPDKPKSHGRAIFRDEARKTGLNIQKMNMKSRVWELVYKLYIRSEMLVSTGFCKCIESAEHSFTAAPPRRHS